MNHPPQIRVRHRRLLKILLLSALTVLPKMAWAKPIISQPLETRSQPPEENPTLDSYSLPNLLPENANSEVDQPPSESSPNWDSLITSEVDSSWFFPESIVFDRIEADLTARNLWQFGNGYSAHSFPQTWPDSCLGLPAQDEVCLPTAVEGWQISIGPDQQQPGFIYRTDLTGEHIRLFEPQVNLPESIRDRILATAAAETGLNPEALSLSAIEPRIWESCPSRTILGIPPECTDNITTLGWRGIVSTPNHHWVYQSHDAEGRNFQLNPSASSDNSFYEPHFIFIDTVIQWVPSAIFQSKLSGGPAGTPTEIFYLTNDGEITHQLVYSDESYTTESIRQISPASLQQFQTLLQSVNLSDFHWLLYTAPDGAEEYRRWEITDMEGLIFLDDYSQETLPPSLQTILQAWDTLIYPE